MSGKLLLTPVDSLVEVLKNKERCSITELQKELQVPMDALEKWLVVLEEFQIIKVHYKGFSALVEYAEKEKEEKETALDTLKENFTLKAKQKNLSYEQIKLIWPEFLKENEEELKKLFFKKAKKLGFEERKFEQAWLKYRKDLEVL